MTFFGWELRRILWVLFLLFIGWWVIQNPHTAGTDIRKIAHGFSYAFTQITTAISATLS